jgi:hypothetical protein
MPPEVGEILVIAGVGGGSPPVVVTLSNVAVPRDDVLLLVTANPM